MLEITLRNVFVRHTGKAGIWVSTLHVANATWYLKIEPGSIDLVYDVGAHCLMQIPASCRIGVKASRDEAGPTSVELAESIFQIASHQCWFGGSRDIFLEKTMAIWLMARCSILSTFAGIHAREESGSLPQTIRST